MRFSGCAKGKMGFVIIWSQTGGPLGARGLWWASLIGGCRFAEHGTDRRPFRGEPWMHFLECPFIRQDARSSRIGTVRPKGVRVRAYGVVNGARKGIRCERTKMSRFQCEFAYERTGLWQCHSARWIIRCATSSFQSARSSILAARGFEMLYY